MSRLFRYTFWVLVNLVLVVSLSACGNSKPQPTLSSTPTIVILQNTNTPTINPTEKAIAEGHNELLMKLVSGEYQVNINGNSTSYVVGTAWNINVTGDQIVGTTYLEGGIVAPLKGYIEGDQVIAEVDCSGVSGASDDCRLIYRGRIKKGNRIVGPVSDGTTWELWLNPENYKYTRTPTKTPAPTQTSEPTITPIPIRIPWNVTSLGPIAYFDQDLKLISPDGSKFSDTYNLTDLRLYAFSWLHDGKLLAYSTHSDQINDFDIYLFSMKDKNSTNITNSPNFNESSPDWSPDGSKIAFEGGKGSSDIYVMNSDGSKFKKMTECADGCYLPDWSPSGEYIAYENNGNIYTMKANGSNQTKVMSGAYNTLPRWSPDGKQLAFLRADERGYKTRKYLYVINADGTGIRALTGNTVNPSHFSWSPDGRFIVFDNDSLYGEIPVSSYSLGLLNVESAEISPLLSDTAGSFPEWSPLLIAQPEPTVTGDCTAGWTRLEVGKQARVMGAKNDPPNRVRSEPKKGDNQIGNVNPGDIIDVLEGPVCVEGLVFWKVKSASIPGTGWTAEGDGKEYWLEPYKK